MAVSRGQFLRFFNDSRGKNQEWTYEKFDKVLKDFGYRGSDTRELFDKADLNRNAAIDSNEFLKAMNQRPENEGFTVQSYSTIRKAFEKVDRNHQGVVPRESMEDIYKSLEEYCSKGEINNLKKLVEKQDSNREYVSYEVILQVVVQGDMVLTNRRKMEFSGDGSDLKGRSTLEVSRRATEK